MYLTIDQFQIVERDVQNEGITYSHLEYDLLDHVCCDIENRMSKGHSFDDAYKEVRSEIGNQGLRRVQEETLLLINKNYRMMKKSMKTLGTIALASMSFAAVAKLMHWPGAGILMALSFLVVAAVFFPAALYVWYKEVFNKERAFIVILTFFAGFIFMAGTLFKIMHWPGAGVLLSGGELLIIITIIIGGISYLLSKNRSKANSNGILVTGIIGLVVFLLGILFKIQHWPGAAVLLLLGSVLFFGIFLTIFIYNTYKEEKSIDTSYIFAVYAVSVVLIFTFLLAINVPRNMFAEFVSTNAKIYNSISIIEGQINDTPESLSDLNEVNIAANNLFSSITDLNLIYS